MSLALDFNAEIYDLKTGDTITFALASSLRKGGEDVDNENAAKDIWRPDGQGQQGLEAEYEYVMYGTVSRSEVPTLSPFFILRLSDLQIRRKLDRGCVSRLLSCYIHC